MKTVLLINSPLHEKPSATQDRYIPPFGLYYIAAELRKQNINVIVRDCVFEGISIDNLVKEINTERYNYVGINIFSMNIHIVQKIVDRIDDSIPIQIGGLIVEAVYQDIIAWSAKNRLIMVIGEGEYITADLVNDTVKENAIYKNGNREVYKVSKESIYFPIDISKTELPFLELSKYYCRNKYNLIEGHMIASRGCIYNCAFCGGANLRNADITVRYLSKDNIKSCISQLVNLGVECVRLLDDLFLANRQHIEEAIDIFNHFSVRWRAMAHVKSLLPNADLFPALKASGCIELFIGIESGSPEIRKFINKAGSINEIRQTVKKLLDAGINVKGYFMYGFPEETIEQMKQTYELADELSSYSSSRALFTTSVFEFRPYHGTFLFDYIIKKYGYVKEYTKNVALDCIENRKQFNFNAGNFSNVESSVMNNFIIKTNCLNNTGTIKSCTRCNLYKYQTPLIDNYKISNVMWVGLSAKIMCDYMNSVPLDISTSTGELIHEVEDCFENVQFYKSNIVKCAPLDNDGKLRYPTKKEIDICLSNLLLEIKLVRPRIIFLLGKQVSDAISQYYSVPFSKVTSYNVPSYKIGDALYIPVFHPSYINVYKKSDRKKYIDSLKQIIAKELQVTYKNHADQSESSMKQISIFDYFEQ